MANGIEQAAPAPRAVAAPAASGGWRFGVAERLIFFMVLSMLVIVGVMTTVVVITMNLQYAAGAGLGVVVLSAVALVTHDSQGRHARPIREMTQVYQNVGKGNYRLRAASTSGDELGELAVTVNTLLDNMGSLVQTRKERDKLQASIVKLLEDVSSVADGNLAVQAEVTADVTGAIADAFNFTVGQLRTLVENVQKTTQEVTISATELQQTSGRLAQMSVAQAGQIGETMTTVGEIALSIERVSADGQESARVARQSLANARAGTEMVAEMIKGMNRIRERVSGDGPPHEAPRRTFAGNRRNRPADRRHRGPHLDSGVERIDSGRIGG